MKDLGSIRVLHPHIEPIIPVAHRSEEPILISYLRMLYLIHDTLDLRVMLFHSSNDLQLYVKNLLLSILFDMLQFLADLFVELLKSHQNFGKTLINIAILWRVWHKCVVTEIHLLLVVLRLEY